MEKSIRNELLLARFNIFLSLTNLLHTLDSWWAPHTLSTMNICTIKTSFLITTVHIYFYVNTYSRNTGYVRNTNYLFCFPGNSFVKLIIMNLSFICSVKLRRGWQQRFIPTVNVFTFTVYLYKHFHSTFNVNRNESKLRAVNIRHRVTLSDQSHKKI